MRGSAGLDEKTCLDIWELLQAGAEGKTVAKVFGVAPSTVSRVNTIFRAVRDGTEDKLAESSLLSQNIVGYAKRLYSAPATAQATSSSGEGADALKEIYKVLCGISYGITKMNEKLEKLCEVWEVKE